MENKRKFLLELDAQYFGGKDEGGTPDKQQGEGRGGDKDERTPEEIEFDKKVEAEADRKLNSALEKKEKEWKEQQAQAIQDALAEKERLSKLSDKERKDEELTQREKDIEKRLKDIERKELLSDAVADLNKKELPTEFAEVLLGEDAESTLENINNFKTAFDKAVNEVVKEKLRQDTPPAGGGTSSNKNTIAQLRNKKDQQQNKAPDLWA